VGDERFELRVTSKGDLAFLYDGTLRMRMPRRFLGVGAVRAVRLGRFLAWDTFRERGRDDRWMRDVERVDEQPDDIFLVYRGGTREAALRVHAHRAETWHWTLTLRAEGAAWNRVMWGLEVGPEVLYGFGTYGNGPRIGRARLATWVEEGPVGLGPLSPFLRWTGRVPLPRRYATYAAVPLFLSSRGYGGWLENSERVEWAVGDGTRRARVWARAVRLHLVAGRDVLETLKRERLCLGRPPLAPPWALGPWIDAVRGEAEVRRRADLLRREEIPATALWVEDWMGSRENRRRFWQRPLSHRVDKILYPDLPGLSSALHDGGFRLLGYFCPEVAEDTALYEEARAGGHLVSDRHGEPVRIEILGHRHGELELTSPKTRAWVMETMFRPALRAGFDGWMADFGEHLPPWARLRDGSDGWSGHNRYPALWHSLNRTFFEEARPAGDWTFFVRSSSLASPALAPVFWGGDQDTDWDPADGLAAVVPGALAAGILGHALYATDIAGYMTFGLTRPAGRELFMRWTELGALLPVMRTHHGTARPRNWHFARDRATLLHFRRFARLHVLLYPYLYRLLEEAHETGLPMVRPLSFYDGRDEASIANQEFLLGEDLLVAPVVQARRSRRSVYLPPGAWVRWWSGETMSGPALLDVRAPIGEIPLFVRKGRALPLSEGRLMETRPGERRTRGFVDTLVNTAPRVSGLRDAEAIVTVLVAGPIVDRLTVALPRDGGVLTIAEAGSGGYDTPSEPILGPVDRDHAPLLGGPGALVRLEPGREASFAVSTTRLRALYQGRSARAFLFRTLETPPASRP